MPCVVGVEESELLMFQGGGHEGSDYSFEDLELEIEPYSMERASEGLAQKRALEMHAMILNSLQATCRRSPTTRGRITSTRSATR